MYEVIVIRKSYQSWNFFGFLGPISPKTLLEESYLARARQVRLTSEFAGELLRRGWSWKQLLSCGTGSLRVVSQGLSCPLLKTFAANFSWSNWPPLSLRGWTLVLMWETNLVLNFFLFLQASNNVCRTLFSKNAKTAKPSIIWFRIPLNILYLFPKFCIKHCFQILLGGLHTPKSMGDKQCLMGDKKILNAWK